MFSRLARKVSVIVRRMRVISIASCSCQAHELVVLVDYGQRLDIGGLSAGRQAVDHSRNLHPGVGAHRNDKPAVAEVMNSS